MMTNKFVFRLPRDSNDKVVRKFNLKMVLSNERTTIYENETMRMSLDKLVARVTLFDSNDKSIIEELNNYFYGENLYDKKK